MSNRVVITGIGAITSVGLTAADSWAAVVEGRSGIDRITLLDTSPYQVKIAGEVKGWNPETHLSRKEIRRRDRYQLLAHKAITESVEQSGLFTQSVNRERIGVVFGSSFGGMTSFTEQLHNIDEHGARRMPPYGVPSFMTTSASSYTSIEYGLGGASSTITSACATGTDCIGHAYQQIKFGYADAMIAGAAEAPILPNAIAGLDRIRACSHNNDSPQQAIRPFDRDRDGLAIAEGAASIVLESYDHAVERDAEILGEIVGYGASSDGFHIVAPQPKGKGAINAIQLALQDAALNPSDIDYINAHGTATLLNDVMETRAIKHALSDDAYHIPVSSTKAVTGHAMGATGAMEAVFSVLALHDDVIPPTINLQNPDDECDLDYIPQMARSLRLSCVMSNSFGFGGHNSVLTIARI